MKMLDENNDLRIRQICTGALNDYNGCGSILFLSKDDIIVSSGCFKTISYSFICPLCGCKTGINEKMISLELKKEILKNEKKKHQKKRKEQIDECTQKIKTLIHKNNK